MFADLPLGARSQARHKPLLVRCCVRVLLPDLMRSNKRDVDCSHACRGWTIMGFNEASVEPQAIRMFIKASYAIPLP